MADKQEGTILAPVPPHMTDRLEEVDFMKARFLSRNLDYFELQLAHTRMQLQEATRLMQSFGDALLEKYQIESHQIDINTGTINREAEKPAGQPDDSK